MHMHPTNYYVTWDSVSDNETKEIIGKTKSILKMLDFIAFDNLPFSIVDSDCFRDIALGMHCCSSSTIQCCLLSVVCILDRKLGTALPTRFGIVLDGWKCMQTHFCACFAVGHGVPNNRWV